MGNFEAIQKGIHMAEHAMELAEAQLHIGMLQEHHNEVEYSQAQALLNMALEELEHLEKASDAVHRDELYRTKLKVLQLQNQMIITPH